MCVRIYYVRTIVGTLVRFDARYCRQMAVIIHTVASQCIQEILGAIFKHEKRLLMVSKKNNPLVV